MKTKKMAATVLLLICLCQLHVAQTTFQKTYGGGAGEKGNSVQQTSDGGYIIAGSTESFGNRNGFTDVYLVKTDAEGDTLWTRTYGGSAYDDCFSVHQNTDLGYILAGHTSSFGNGGFDVYLIRTDLNGDMLWSKTYGGASDDDGYDVKQTTDGGFIITGQTLNFGAINHDVYLLKTDADGNIAWTRTFGKSGDDYGYSVLQTKDGGYIVGGNKSEGGFYLIKTNVSGDTLWTRNYFTGSVPHINVAYSLQQTADDGYIVAGNTYPVDIFLVKTNVNGSIQWSKTIGGPSHDYALSVRQTTDGGFIIGGWSMSFPVGSYHSLIVRTDATGELTWSKTYSGGGTSPVGYSVKQTSDGGFIFLSSTSSFGAGLWDMYLVKTDENGNSGSCNQGIADPAVTAVTTVSNPSTVVGTGGTAFTPLTKAGRGGIVTDLCSITGTSDLVVDNSLIVYPNPFNNELIVKGIRENGIIIINDVNGKEILRTITRGEEIRLNTGSLLPGFYFFNYTGNKKSSGIKLIKF